MTKKNITVYLLFTFVVLVSFNAFTQEEPLENNQQTNNTRPATSSNAFVPTDRPITEESAAASSQPVFAPKRLLLGVIIRGEEVAAFDVIEEKGQFWLPLKELTEVIQSTYKENDQGMNVYTPIGGVIVKPKYLRDYDGQLYVSQQALSEQLAAPLEYNQRESALIIDTPWFKDSGQVTETEQRKVELDAVPPKNSISSMRADIRADYIDSDTNYYAEIEFKGKLADGFWLTRYLDDYGSERYLDEYTWYKLFDNKIVGLGTQQSIFHPLLENFQFVGAQYAQTNQGINEFGELSETDIFNNWSMRPIRNFQGEGPPGGVAELRIDDRVVAQVFIRLDGTYEFRNVPLPGNQFNNVEVLIYDRAGSPTPVARQNFSQSNSELLLKKGTYIHLLGAGMRGNPLSDFDDSLFDDEPIGYYQLRYGVTDGLTLEGAVQEDGNNVRVLGNAVAKLGKRWIMSLGAATNGDAKGYQAEFEGYGKKWRFNARSYFYEEDYVFEDAEEEYEHYAEYAYRLNDKLELGLVGRAADPVEEDEKDEYILPTVAWTPNYRTSFRARPNFDGNYRYDFFYRINNRTLFDYVYEDDEHNGRLEYAINNNWQFIAGAEVHNELADRYETVVEWFSSKYLGGFFRAGISTTDGTFGYFLNAQKMILPGLIANLEVSEEPEQNTPDIKDLEIFLTITADYTFAGKKFLPSQSSSIRHDRGGIAGSVNIKGPKYLQDYSLDGVGILIDGRPAPDSSRKGSFFAGNLPTGDYLVELDIENLPIELVPEQKNYWVRVEGAAVTRVDFWVRPEFGVAGTIKNLAGKELANVIINLLNESGTVVATSITDKYGLYRVDGIEPGRYQLQPTMINKKPLEKTQSINVEIVDDFLFGQDIVLPITP